MTNPLLNSSILLHIEIRKWSGEVADKKALQIVAAKTGSDTHNDKYKKSLFVTDALAEIDCCAGRIRNHFYYESVPWLDGGKGRLIPSLSFQEFAVKHKKLKIDFYKAVEYFIENYEDHVEEAKDKKGQMFIEAEYPKLEDLSKRFDIILNTLPFPNTKDIRLDAPAEIIAELESSMAESISRVESVVSGQLEERFQKRIRMLVKTLKVGKRFNVSLLTELEKVIQMAANIKEAIDPDLLNNMNTVEKCVLIYSPDEIRNSISIQDELIEICEGVLL